MITERPRPRRARLATTAWLFLLYLVMTNETTTAETLYEGLPTGPGLIREDRDGTVYAAVIGAADGIVLRYADGDWEIWHKGPIQGLQVAPDGDLWIAQGSFAIREIGVGKDFCLTYHDIVGERSVRCVPFAIHSFSDWCSVLVLPVSLNLRRLWNQLGCG